MICIRQAVAADDHAIIDVVERAFQNVCCSSRHLPFEVSDDSDFFIPELSLVAEIDDHKIVGYIYLMEISIDCTFPSLGLARIAVAPEYQGLGIGSMMIEKAHQIAKELGYVSVISLGGKQFLSKFGYRTLVNFGIHYGVFDNQCLAVELYPGAIAYVHGKVGLPLDYLQEIF